MAVSVHIIITFIKICLWNACTSINSRIVKRIENKSGNEKNWNSSQKTKKKTLKYFTCHNNIGKSWSFRAHDDLINLMHVFIPFNINYRFNENALTVYLESNPWSLTSTSTSDRLTCLYDTAVVTWPISVLLNKLQVLNTVSTSSPVMFVDNRS